MRNVMIVLGMILVVSGCDTVSQSPCGPLSAPKGYTDATTGESYSIGGECNLISYGTKTTCKTAATFSFAGNINDIGYSPFTSTFNVTQSQAMAGCMPTGSYSCTMTFMVADTTRDLIVDCASNGYFRLQRNK